MKNYYRKSIGLDGCQECLEKELLKTVFLERDEGILPEFKTDPKEASRKWAHNVLALIQVFHDKMGKTTVQIKKDNPDLLEYQEGSTKLTLKIAEIDSKIRITYTSIRGKGRSKSLYICPIDFQGNLINSIFFTSETKKFAFTCSRFLFEPLVEKGLWFKKINAAFSQKPIESAEISQPDKPPINPARLVLDFECTQIIDAITDPHSKLFIHLQGLPLFDAYLKEFSPKLRGIEKLAAIFVHCIKSTGLNPHELMLGADRRVNEYTGNQPTQRPTQTLRALNQEFKGRTIITDDLIHEFSNARLRTGLPRKDIVERLKVAFNELSINKNPNREFNQLHYKMPSQGNETADARSVEVLRSFYKSKQVKYAVPGDVLYEQFSEEMKTRQFKSSDLYGVSQRVGIQITRKSIDTIYRNLENKKGAIPIELATKILEIIAP